MSTLLRQIAPDPNTELMGLQNHGYSLFPDCTTSMEIPFVNGKYNLGLDGKENKKLKDEFERHFGVTFDSPEGLRFLEEYNITIRHDVTAYDSKNLDHAFDLQILKANNGMGIVATSDLAFEKTPVNTFKFIVQSEAEEVEKRVDKKKLKATAISELSTLSESNTKRLILISKYLFDASASIGSNKQLAFDKLYDFVDQSIDNCEIFLNTLKLEPSYLFVVTTVKDAIYRNVIRQHNGQYVLYATQTPLGRNQDEVIQFCLDPKNEDLVGKGLKDDSPTSIVALLNN